MTSDLRSTVCLSPAMTPHHATERRWRGFWRLGLLSISTLMILFGVFPNQAGAQVHDNAQLFSADAKQQAQSTIEQMRQKTGKSLLIETYKSVPPDQADKLQSLGKAAFINQFTRDRGKAEQVNGVVFVIFVDLKDAHVEIGKNTLAEKLFTPHDVDDMRSAFAEAYGKEKYDEALTRTATFVANRISENKAQASSSGRSSPSPSAQNSSQTAPPSLPRPEADTPGCGIGLSGLICVGLAVVGIIFLVRVISNRSQNRGYAGQDMGSGGGPGYSGGPGYGGPGYGGPGYGQQRGSGFGSGLLGGVLGGVAGSWIGNKVFGQEHNNPPAGGDVGHNQSSAGYQAPSDYSGPADTDYSSGGDIDLSGGSSGGGFDSGGGSDFGGGDSGGGGGDSGGGGDF